MYKDNGIVVNSFYGVKHWYFLVLSRAGRLSGIYFETVTPEKYHYLRNINIPSKIFPNTNYRVSDLER